MEDFSGKLYVPIRSVQPSRHSCELLYVPVRSVYVPHIKDFAGKLYVPIRSVQPSRDSCIVSRDSHSCPNVAILFPFLYVPLYVPIRSCTFHELRRIVLHQPWSARPVEICYRPHRKKQNTINSYTFLYVPRHASCICCKM